MHINQISNAISTSSCTDSVTVFNKHVDGTEGLKTTEATPDVTKGRSSQRDPSSLYHKL